MSWRYLWLSMLVSALLACAGIVGISTAENNDLWLDETSILKPIQIDIEPVNELVGDGITLFPIAFAQSLQHLYGKTDKRHAYFVSPLDPQPEPDIALEKKLAEVAADPKKGGIIFALVLDNRKGDQVAVKEQAYDPQTKTATIKLAVTFKKRDNKYVILRKIDVRSTYFFAFLEPTEIALADNSVIQLSPNDVDKWKFEIVTDDPQTKLEPLSLVRPTLPAQPALSADVDAAREQCPLVKALKFQKKD